jgi:NAD(P)-dependent dehydrogenase (short-subunit alcohol dehydrogenase family)
MRSGRLAGKRVVVTGAASGIGRAIASRFAAEGASVVAADLDGEGARRTAASIGHLAVGASVDIRDETSVRALFEAVERGAPLDVLVNVAGVGSTAATPDTTVEVWDEVMAVNSRGTFLCCKHALRAMLPRQGGSIVNIASVAGLVGLRDRSAYCASKGAVVAFTRAMAIDHVADGIRINCVCPGTVDTPWVRRLTESGESLDALVARQPMGRLGTPEEIADAALFLASDDSSFMTGSVLVVDGGFTAG